MRTIKKTKNKYRELARVFNALSNENRIKIMDMLLDGELCACILLEELDITKSTLSHHIQVLINAGLVDYRKVGKWVHYSITKSELNNIKKIIKGTK